MNRTLAVFAITALSASGCVVYDRGPDGPDNSDVIVGNAAPLILSSEAGAYWDSSYRDDIWYFEADVDDPDGVLDVVAVYADVYDGFDGSWVDSFELYPTNDPYYWFSDWLGSSTYLDVAYGLYDVEFVAYDSYDATDAVTVAPYYF